jgi:hypothetical protein
MKHQKTITLEGISYDLLPVDGSKIVVENGRAFGPLRIGDQIVCYEKGKLCAVTISDIMQTNYLPRFRINKHKWIGKTKIVAKIRNSRTDLPTIMFNELAVLEEIVNQDVYVMTDPDILDFTSKRTAGRLILCSKTIRIGLAIPTDQKDLLEFKAVLQDYLGRTSMIVGWNFKNFLSYILARTGKPFQLSVNYYDLRILESYVGLENPIPEGFSEAIFRLKKVTKNKSWEKLKNIYKCVYIPLTTEVVPKIETLGLIHRGLKTDVHPYYEIDGQKNGRMKCTNCFEHSINPHTLSDEDKANLRPRSFEDQVFLSFDYKHMEVSVLQWLSHDPVLTKLANSGEDMLLGIYQIMTGQKPQEGSRDRIKSFFLPVVFGSGVQAVMDRMKVSEQTATKLVDFVYTKFSVALGYVKSQEVDAEGYCTDHFGRQRKFEEDKLYLTRNFVIQSAASLICLHKLVQLDRAVEGLARIVMHIHDGYVLVMDKAEAKRVIRIGTDVLQAADPLYPDLRLRVSVKQGARMDQLQ